MLIPLLQRKLISAAHICDLILSVPTLVAIGELDLLVYGQRCVHAFTTADQHDVDMNVRKSNTGDTNGGGEWTGCYTPVSCTLPGVGVGCCFRGCIRSPAL